MRVLVLKAPKETLESVDPYVTALQSVNIVAEGVDVLSFQYVNKEDLLKKILNPDDFGGLVFTSPRGVTAVSLCLEGKTLEKSLWSALPSYVVGEGTARVVWEKLGLESIGQESGSAQQLAEFICKDLPTRHSGTKPLLFPSADLKRNLLLDTLSDAGFILDVVTSYKTVPNPHLKLLLEEKFTNENVRPDTLVFFSPSGVKAVLPYLVETAISLKSLKMIAIGSTTKSVLEEHGLPVFATAATPSPSGLVEAITIPQCSKMDSKALSNAQYPEDNHSMNRNF